MSHESSILSAPVHKQMGNPGQSGRFQRPGPLWAGQGRTYNSNTTSVPGTRSALLSSILNRFPRRYAHFVRIAFDDFLLQLNPELGGWPFFLPFWVFFDLFGENACSELRCKRFFSRIL
jgi:hypothetical protein